MYGPFDSTNMMMMTMTKKRNSLLVFFVLPPFEKKNRHSASLSPNCQVMKESITSIRAQHIERERESAQHSRRVGDFDVTCSTTSMAGFSRYCFLIFVGVPFQLAEISHRGIQQSKYRNLDALSTARENVNVFV